MTARGPCARKLQVQPQRLALNVSKSIRTISSKLTRLRPRTCHRPVIPGAAAGRRLCNPGTTPPRRRWAVAVPQAHVTAQDVEELRQLVQAGLADEAAHSRDAQSAFQLEAASAAGRQFGRAQVPWIRRVTWAWCRVFGAATMEPNSNIVKGWPFWPMRCWR